MSDDPVPPPDGGFLPDGPDFEAAPSPEDPAGAGPPFASAVIEPPILESASPLSTLMDADASEAVEPPPSSARPATATATEHLADSSDAAPVLSAVPAAPAVPALPVSRLTKAEAEAEEEAETEPEPAAGPGSADPPTAPAGLSSSPGERVDPPADRADEPRGGPGEGSGKPRREERDRPRAPRGPRPDLAVTELPLFRESRGYRMRLEPPDLARLRELPGSKGKTDRELGELFFDGQSERFTTSLAEDVPSPAEVRVVVDPYSRQAFLAVEKKIRSILSF